MLGIRRFAVPQGTYGVRVSTTIGPKGDGYACLETVSRKNRVWRGSTSTEIKGSRIDFSELPVDYPPFVIDWEEL